jgi:SMODS and SLOG-associating 2TM effector domain 1
MSQPANYKETRLEKQIEWHSNKAKYNKLKFRQVQIITLVASAIIPIINVRSAFLHRCNVRGAFDLFVYP